MTRSFLTKAVLVSFASLAIASFSLAPSSAQADSVRKNSKTPAQPTSGGVAGEPDVDGCGLGWQVTHERTLLGSITRGTTNSTVPPSFGMTSGTLGCAQLPISQNEQDAVKYAYLNIDSLSVEMAAGQGEYLQAFAETMGCGAVAGSFSQMAQAHYDAIMNHGKASAFEMYQNVKHEIHSDGFLAASCGV